MLLVLDLFLDFSYFYVNKKRMVNYTDGTIGCWCEQVVLIQTGTSAPRGLVLLRGSSTQTLLHVYF